jgi:hypothetical protein
MLLIEQQLDNAIITVPYSNKSPVYDVKIEVRMERIIYTKVSGTN